jgi:hypothetical protein
LSRHFRGATPRRTTFDSLFQARALPVISDRSEVFQTDHIFEKETCAMTQLSLGALLALLTVTATGYALATVGMKMASNTHSPFAMLIIALALGGAVFAEIVLLRSGHMSMIYLAIVVMETAMVLGYAAIIGQGLSMLQFSGALLVLIGFALVTSHG